MDNGCLIVLALIILCVIGIINEIGKQKEWLNDEKRAEINMKKWQKEVSESMNKRY